MPDGPEKQPTPPDSREARLAERRAVRRRPVRVPETPGRFIARAVLGFIVPVLLHSVVMCGGFGKLYRPGPESGWSPDWVLVVVPLAVYGLLIAATWRISPGFRCGLILGSAVAILIDSLCVAEGTIRL